MRATITLGCWVGILVVGVAHLAAASAADPLQAMPPAVVAAPAQIDLSKADEAELMQLPRVGRTRAQAILAYRSAHGIRRTTDLLKVKGIGLKTFQKLKPLVRVGPAPGASGAGTGTATATGGVAGGAGSTK